MVDQGNFGEVDPQETPRMEELFGKEIKVYPNATIKNFNYNNWFKIGTKTFLWKKDTHSRVPKYPYDPSRDATKETDTWQDYLEAIGIMYYGATFDEKTNTFIDNPELPPLSNLTKIQDRAKSLTGVSVSPSGVPKGYAKQSVQTAINVLQALDLYGKETDEPFDPSEEESEYDKIQATRDQFRDSPKITQWFGIMRKSAGTSKTKAQKNIDMLYRFMVISGHTSYPQHYTDGYKGTQSIIDKTVRLKTDVEKFKHWAMTRLTPATWYKEAKDVGFEVQEGDMEGDHLELNVYADEVKGKLDDWDRKVVSIRKWKEGISGTDQVKQVADALASFVKYSGGDHNWAIPDPQPIQSVLSRRIKDPTKASLGEKLTDKEIMAGMKFLETGKRWIWVMSETEKEKITEIDADGKEVTHTVPKEVLVEDETDTDPHHNTHLRIYEQWGNPYGETAPANMFFRLALSGTGWRKAEALTCKNEEISKITAPEKKSGIYFKDDKLKVVFQTRKTERLGGAWVQHTSTIPPLSSDLIDSRHTIEIVLAKQNKYRLKEYPSTEREEIPKSEREEARPARKFGKKWERMKGQVSRTLIGLENQFIPVELLTAKTGGDLKGKWNDPAISAYLFVPFKEMYSMMKGTGVTVKTEGEVKRDRTILIEDKYGTLDKKNKKGKGLDPATRIFPMDKWGWALSFNEAKPFENEVYRIRQDSDRWTDPDDYWINKPLHSIRHVFAQTWLRKSKWNFGLVADIGHWKIIDTLKLHYGDRDDDDVIDQLAGLFAESDSEAKTKELKRKLKQKLDSEDADEFKKPTADQGLSEAETEKLGGVSE